MNMEQLPIEENIRELQIRRNDKLTKYPVINVMGGSRRKYRTVNERTRSFAHF